MTLALDTSALLARYLDIPERAVVLEAMAADADWCASSLARGWGSGPTRRPTSAG